MGTLTLPGADIRGYYNQLGIPLPDRPGPELSVRCFADPGSHRREDRDPSCSVNAVNGAWRCHGCGARGGAYDAALAVGHTPRAAIDLMITYGLIERRAQLRTARELIDAAPSRARDIERPARPVLNITEQDVDRWQTALSRRPSFLTRLADERGWHYATMRELGLGLHQGRITIPIRNQAGLLRGVLRYQPHHVRRPKMLAAAGSRLGLIPHPVTETSPRLILVEGPPDMIAARSRGLPAIAVPGDHAWQRRWARLLAGRRVTVIMDADPQGRTAAIRIARDLVAHAYAEIIDLAPGRNDGYDLTDWLLDHAGAAFAHMADVDRSAAQIASS
ncbi:MAG: toprim domain-containing protein [Solirubrobacteraceae bacterium]